MIRFLLFFFGFFLRIIPAFVLHGMCWLMGRIFLLLFRARRRIILSNLSHVFPTFTHGEIRRIANIHAARLVEMGMFSLLSPFWSKARMTKNFCLQGDWETFRNNFLSKKVPQILLIPHQTLSEAMVLLPHLLHFSENEHECPIRAIYRPFQNPSLERYILRSRERFGLRLLSRKNGLMEAAHTLRSGGSVALLFDQYAGASGTWTTLCGMITSTTHLPELFFRDCGAILWVAHMRRLRFFHASLVCERLENQGENVIHSMDMWLENQLRRDPIFRENWLWSHRRWKCSNGEILRLQAKRSIIEDSCQLHGWKELPKKFRIFIRMPNWLGDIAMTLSIIRSIHRSRPDACITVLCRPAHGKWLQSIPWIDHVRILPHKGRRYYGSLLRLRKQLPDLHILFTNSLRGDLESWIIGAPIRMGLLRTRRQMRSLLTHKALVDEKIHQTYRWHKFLRKFGMDDVLDLTPICAPEKKDHKLRIGFCFGKNNNSTKCWPTKYWNQLAHLLLHRYPQVHIVLFGMDQDGEEADEICHDLPAFAFSNFVGKTSVGAFAALLRQCSLVVAIDSGSMHLANVLAVPVVALFGPTDQRISGPIYDAPCICINATHNAEMVSIFPQQVLEGISQLIICERNGGESPREK
ncbi:MAG: hypothetical protein LBG86_00075 [Puniceicoccales bacterium]|jgi:ADP-heptose:LPS heptosyltransferase/lauroyl/myristoyl acyltransferase|nr:hypothetical protein [Puniceicoccales bacterium]